MGSWATGDRRLVAAVLLVVLLVTGACRGGDGASSEATVPEVGPTTTTAPADEWAVPATIDVAYVEKVLAELDRIDGDAARIIVAEGELVPAAVDRLRAIYGTAELNLQLELWGEDIADGFDGIRRPPGNRTTGVDNVIVTAASCIFAATRVDLTAVAEDAPPEPRRSYMILRRLDSAWDPRRINATGWVIESARVPATGSEPSNPCPS